MRKVQVLYSSCQKLLGKDRIYEIGDPTKTQRGDIIYTFDSSQAEGKQYTHVTIATSNYSSAIGGCYICGHSVNQNGDYGDTKKLVAGKVKIYRVRTSVIVTFGYITPIGRHSQGDCCIRSHKHDHPYMMHNESQLQAVYRKGQYFFPNPEIAQLDDLQHQGDHAKRLFP